VGPAGRPTGRGCVGGDAGRGAVGQSDGGRGAGGPAGGPQQAGVLHKRRRQGRVHLTARSYSTSVPVHSDYISDGVKVGATSLLAHTVPLYPHTLEQRRQGQVHLTACSYCAGFPVHTYTLAASLSPGRGLATSFATLQSLVSWGLAMSYKFITGARAKAWCLHIHVDASLCCSLLGARHFISHIADPRFTG
jgi:hypothetical protein